VPGRTAADTVKSIPAGSDELVLRTVGKGVSSHSKAAAAKSSASDKGQRYRAPALEKGIDILELIATQPAPISLQAIVKALGRSTGELFRMIQVLQFRGFIEQSADGGGFQLTGRLLALAMNQPSVKGLIEISLPRMRLLAAETGQSCHLVMHSQGQIVVIARVESSAEMGFSVRVGHRRSLPETVSGTLLYAFQSERTRERWEELFDPHIPADELAGFRQRAARARDVAWAKARSTFVAGVTDISAPVLRGHEAAAALTIPFVQFVKTKRTLEDCLALLITAAREISGGLLLSDSKI
jgi:DNA-binding IclR family transcriptional regulator